MSTETACENNIEDPIIRDLMLYCRDDAGFKIAHDENGNSLCGELHFAFHFPYRGKTIKVLVERHGDRVVRQGQLKLVEDLNAPYVGEFLNEIGNPSNQFLPGVITEMDHEGSPKRYAVIRGDIEIDEKQPKRNRVRFMDTMIRLRQQLVQLPSDLFST